MTTLPTTLPDARRRLEGVNKKKIEGMLAFALYRKIRSELIMVILTLTYFGFVISIIIMTWSNTVPSQLRDSVALVNPMKADTMWGQFLSSMWFLASMLIFYHNARGLRGSSKLLDYSLRIAERDAPRKAASID